MSEHGSAVETPDLDVADLLGLALARRLSSVFGAARGEPSLIVHLSDSGADLADPNSPAERGDLDTLPAVVIGVGRLDQPSAALVDVIVGSTKEARTLAGVVRQRPLASVALALLLRHDGERSIAAGLIAESTTYSMMQAGTEFASWRAGRPAPGGTRHPASEPPVLVDIDGMTTLISLNRPTRHNAVDLALSEHLVEALTAAITRPGSPIVLSGRGPSFCSGGDLDEFGSFPDPVIAHTARLSRSAGHLIAMMAPRVEVQLHGACIGAGIELAAFAGTVIARDDTRISLPELSLGLVPGAGGTVSLPRRIGRHRTALLALRGDVLDAATALEWGLVDRVV